MREGLVADREDLVDQEDVGIAVRGDREAQAHGHAGGIGLDGGVQKRLDAGEPHDGLEAGGDLLLRQAEEQARDLDVLPPRELRVKARAELEQGRQPAAHGDGSGGRTDDAGQELQQSGLARAVGPDDAERLPRGNVEGDALERGHGLLPGGARRAARQKSGLERAVRPPRVAPVELRHLAHGDGRFRAHASSASESRSASNRAPPAARQTAAVPGHPDPVRGRHRAEVEERVVHRREVAGERVGAQQPAEAVGDRFDGIQDGCQEERQRQQIADDVAARRRSGPRAPKRREPGRRRPASAVPGPAETAGSRAPARRGRAPRRRRSRPRAPAERGPDAPAAPGRPRRETPPGPRSSCAGAARWRGTSRQRPRATRRRTPRRARPRRERARRARTSARGAKTQRKTVA